MKTCSYCQDTAFEDMEVCYGCLHPFEKRLELLPLLCDEQGDTVCLNVELAGVFAYKIHLLKTEGALLTVGKSSRNAIVIPREEIADHHLDIFFSQESLWAECKGRHKAFLDGMTLTGSHALKKGCKLTVGAAVITVV